MISGSPSLLPGAGASTGAAVVAGTGAAAGGTAGTDTTGGAGAGTGGPAAPMGTATSRLPLTPLEMPNGTVNSGPSGSPIFVRTHVSTIYQRCKLFAILPYNYAIKHTANCTIFFYCIYIYTHLFLYYVCMYVCTYVRTYVCIYIYYVYMYIYIMCIYIYILCIYIYIMRIYIYIMCIYICIL